MYSSKDEQSIWLDYCDNGNENWTSSTIIWHNCTCPMLRTENARPYKCLPIHASRDSFTTKNDIKQKPLQVHCRRPSGARWKQFMVYRVDFFLLDLEKNYTRISNNKGDDPHPCKSHARVSHINNFHQSTL